MVETEQLMGIYEIAEMAGVTRAAVANWRTRFRDFPTPVRELRSGPVFDRAHVRHWLARRRGGVANALVMLNIARGVGTSTTTVALAEVLAADLRKRVLVVDLDPQMTATIALLGPERWAKLSGKNKTVAALFERVLLDKPPWRKLDVASLIARGASPVEDARTLDLLPSTLDLADLYEKLTRLATGPFHVVDPTAVVQRAIAPLQDNYDVILIDCPPDLGLLTLNGLRFATGYIVPVRPDAVSTYGLKRIQERVATFGTEAGVIIDPVGLVLARWRDDDPAMAKLRKRLGRAGIPLMTTAVPDEPGPADESGYRQVTTAQQRYGDTARYAAYLDLAEELLAALEPTSKQTDPAPDAAADEAGAADESSDPDVEEQDDEQ